MTAKKTAEKKPADKPAPESSKTPKLSKEDLEVMASPEWQALRAGVVVLSEDESQS